MNKRPIGIFDSGLGGISVLRDIAQLMPCEDYIYYGDSANAPYGTKSTDDILILSEHDADFLLARDVKAIVIACNTATSVAAEYLRKKHGDIPIIGIEPALKPAVLWKEHDRVAVMATPATLALPKFRELMSTYSPRADIYPIPCPGLADYVEKGIFDGEELENFLTKLLSPCLDKGLDAIVLGCTHYPFVENSIRKVAGDGIRIFNGAHGTAMELQRRLTAAKLLTDSTEHGKVDFYSSSTDPKVLDMCIKLYNS